MRKNGRAVTESGNHKIIRSEEGKGMTMTQDERRIWLIRQLQKEMPEYAELAVPEDKEQQWHLLRGLFNVRMPGETTAEFKKVESEFLREMTRGKGITDSDELKPARLDPRLARGYHDAEGGCDCQCGEQWDDGLLSAQPQLYR